MKAQIRQMRQDRAKLAEEAGKILELAHKTENRNLTPEESARFDDIHRKIEALGREVERLEAQEAIEAGLRSSASDPAAALGNVDERRQYQAAASRDDEERLAQERAAFLAYLCLGSAQMTEHERTILSPYRAKVSEREIREELRGQHRAQAVGTDGAGGYLVPEGFMPELVAALKSYGVMLDPARSGVRTLVTATGNPLPWPTVDDTGQTGALINENTAAAEQDATFTAVTLNAYKFSSKMIRVSNELLQDSAVDVPAFLNNALGIRVGRVLNTYFTTGTGTSQPKGVVTAAASGKVGTTGQTTTVIYDDLVDLEHSVDPSYRMGARFMMNDLSLAILKKLKVNSEANHPAWQPGIAAGQPDRILGYPFAVNQDMATMAANAKSILFGDFSQYVYRRVRDFTLIRLVERYAEYDQVAFLGWARADGNLVSAGSPIKYYQNSAT